jgi:maltose O-acetyltransferase
MKSEKEKMLAGELYSPFNAELAAERLKAKQLLHRFNSEEGRKADQAARILAELMPNAPNDLYVEPPFYCDYGSNIHCGKRVYFNTNCLVLDAARISIGSYVFIGPSVHIYGATHPTDAKERRSRALAKPVSIGDDCWIGGGAIICPGVTIGKGCVIAAGAVVTKDVADHTLVAGNPAMTIKKLQGL